MTSVAQLQTENAILQQQLNQRFKDEEVTRWKEAFRDKYKQQKARQKLQSLKQVISKKDKVIVNQASIISQPFAYPAYNPYYGSMSNPYFNIGGSFSPISLQRNPAYDYMTLQNNVAEVEFEKQHQGLRNKVNYDKQNFNGLG